MKNKQNNMIKQSKITHYALIMALLCLHVVTKAQQLQNPSFEGSYGVAQIPQEWSPFGRASSPDTQPGAWNVTTPASHGNSCLSMVCRGFSIYNNNLWEGCIQKLNTPLVVGQAYHYSIDLAFSKTFKADTILFDQPAQLRVWGMNANMNKELLWESGAVKNTDWKKVDFEITPSQPTDYFILEAYYVTLPKYCGNILIDNIQYYPQQKVKSKDTIIDVIAENTNLNIDENGLPISFNDRKVNEVDEYIFKGEKLRITIWDNRTTDGDVVSLFLNKKNILKEFSISKDRLEIEVNVEEGKEYYLTLYAHNLGKIPPNTVALYVSDGLRKKFLTLSSDLEKCEAVRLKIEHELASVELRVRN